MIWEDLTLTKNERTYWKKRHRGVHNYARKKMNRSSANCVICNGGPSDISHILPIINFGPYVEVGTIPTVFMCKSHHIYFDRLIETKMFAGLDWRKGLKHREGDFFEPDRYINKILAFAEITETAWFNIVYGGFQRQLHYDKIMEIGSLAGLVDQPKSDNQLRWEQHARRLNSLNNINNVPTE